jgi:micrococcal nuclease
VAGQEVEAVVERVVDGDTVRVLFGDRSVSLRLQCLDTEESEAGGAKEVTPWGKKTSDYVKGLLAAGDIVRIVLQSEAPLFDADGAVAVEHLDNFKRLLGFLLLATPVADGGPATDDYQELIIRQGYSPYFVKYGRVSFPELDQRYAAAERFAQAGDLGLWNQLAVNGTVARDYATLGIWWDLRSHLIDAFRRAREADTTGNLLNSRLDYPRLVERAGLEDTVTVFLELRALQASGRHALINTGSLAQPFRIFIPDADAPDRAPLRRLLANRYLGTDETRPRRNYAYVSGLLQLWRNQPEMVVTDIAQISDGPPPA